MQPPPQTATHPSRRGWLDCCCGFHEITLICGHVKIRNSPTQPFCGFLFCPPTNYLQTEISKRLNAIIAQVVPYLSQEHQQQVATAVDRAKQITMTELNAVIGQQRPDLPRLLQQMHAQQLPGHAGAPPMPLGMPHPSLVPGGALSAAAAAAAAAAGAPGAGGPLGLGNPPPGHPLALKPEPHRPEETKSNSGMSVSDQDRHVSCWKECMR